MGLREEIDGRDVREVSRLLAEGANVNEKLEYDQTYLHWASNRGLVEIAKVLIKYGANVNAQATNGTTPLYWAVSEMENAKTHHQDPAKNKCALELIDLLLKSGADPNLRFANEYCSALELAKAYGQLDAVKLLVAREPPSEKALGHDLSATKPAEEVRKDKRPWWKFWA